MFTPRTPRVRLPYHTTLETFDFSFQPRNDERQVRELATLQWVDAAANLVTRGPPGIGKPHIIIGWPALAGIQARYSVPYITIQDLVAALRQGRQRIGSPPGRRSMPARSCSASTRWASTDVACAADAEAAAAAFRATAP